MIKSFLITFPITFLLTTWSSIYTISLTFISILKLDPLYNSLYSVNILQLLRHVNSINVEYCYWALYKFAPAVYQAQVKFVQVTSCLTRETCGTCGSTIWNLLTLSRAKFLHFPKSRYRFSWLLTQSHTNTPSLLNIFLNVRLSKIWIIVICMCH